MKRRRRFSRKLQAAPARVPADPSSTGEPRRGLARRYFGALAQRRILRALTTPAAVPLVLAGVVLVFAAIALGAALGAALVAQKDTAA